jgi:uncharacterized protein YlxP (DUF503 family)
MKAGLLTLRFHLPHVQSLKEKRSIVKAILAEIERRGTAYAAAEVEDLDRLDRATIQVAHVSNDPQRTDAALTQIRNALELRRDFALESFDAEIL